MRRTLRACAAVLLAACSSDTLQRMQVQPKYRPYSENPLFEDGRAMRPLPAGTVARERLEELDVPGAGGPGGYLTQVPIPLTPELLAGGRKDFEIICAACHGLLGDGDSPVARNMSLRPPPSLHRFADRPPGFFYSVVTEGFGLMPSFANELPARQRWAVVAYVRALHLSQSAPLTAAPEPELQRLLEEPP